MVAKDLPCQFDANCQKKKIFEIKEETKMTSVLGVVGQSDII